MEIIYFDNSSIRYILQNLHPNPKYPDKWQMWTEGQKAEQIRMDGNMRERNFVMNLSTRTLLIKSLHYPHYILYDAYY